MSEIWKPVKGYPHYFVGNTGKVKSNFYNKETVLSPRICDCGYLFVNLYGRNGKMKSIKIHRLVAEAFIPNPNNLPQVNHKSENKQNNHVYNLEWCTVKYNLTYNGLQKRQHDLQKRKIGAFTKEMVLAHYFPSATDAANFIIEQGISKSFRSSVANICRAAKIECSKLRYGFIWRYLEPSHRKDG